MTAIYYPIILLAYLPGFLFIAKSKTIGRFPIPLFGFLGLFIFNAAGSIIVLTKEYSYSGVYLVNIEYVWMLVLQPLIFYMICGPYILLRRGYIVELKGDQADRPFSVVVMFAILAVLWLYRQEVGYFLIFELLAGNVDSQSVLAYRQAFSYGLENFTYYRLGLVVLPAILLAHTLLVCFAKKSFDLGSVSIIAFSVLLPTILAEKSMFLPMAVIAACAYSIYWSTTGEVFGKILRSKIVWFFVIAFIPTLLVYLFTVAKANIVNFGSVNASTVLPQAIEAITYRVIGVYSEALAALTPMMNEYGEMSGATLPTVRGLFPHAQVLIERAMHAYLFEPEAVHNAFDSSIGFGGALPIPALGEGYINFGWKGFFGFAILSFASVLFMQELLIRVKAGILSYTLMAWYGYLAMTISQTSIFATLVSLIYTVLLVLLVVTYWAVGYAGRFARMRIAYSPTYADQGWTRMRPHGGGASGTRAERMRFSEVYREVVSELEALFPEDISAIATHNSGWQSGRFDPIKYLRDSEVRYWRAYTLLKEDNTENILDVGGFLGAFPLVMQRLGYEVTIAEKFSYYGTSLDDIKHHLQTNGVRVIDIDFTESSAEIDGLASIFDGVTCMAVAEHLAHSPKILMENMRTVLKSRGSLIFEVPNLAFWPNRFSLFFKGATVMSPIQDLYHSAIPFTGHHREYTLDDARYVIGESGFTILDEDTFNYSIDTTSLWQILKFAPAFMFKKWAEVLLIHCRNSDDAESAKQATKNYGTRAGMRVRSVIQVLLSDAMSRAILVVVGVALIRFMPQAEYAIYIFAFSVATLVSQTVAGSFNRVYIVGFDRLGLENAQPSILLLQIVGVTAIFVLGLPFADYFNDVYWFVFALVVAICLSEFPKTFAQRELRFVRFSMIEILRAVVTAICLTIVIYVVRFDLKTWQVLFIQAGAMLLAFLVFTGSDLNLKGLMKVGDAARLVVEFAKGEYRYLFGYFLLLAFFLQVDVIMLRLMSDEHELATYGSAFRYYSILALALGAVHAVYLPLIQQIQDYADLEKIYSTHKMISLLFVPVVILAGWASQWVIPWVDVGKYPNAVTVFRILGLSIIISFAFSPHINLVMRFEKFRFLLGLISVGLLINVTLNVLLIPAFGATGVAVATLVAAASVNIPIYFKSARVSAKYIDRPGASA